MNIFKKSSSTSSVPSAKLLAMSKANTAPKPIRETRGKKIDYACLGEHRGRRSTALLISESCHRCK